MGAEDETAMRSPELGQPVAVERDGVMYVVGIRDGGYWIRRTADRGQSWLLFSDGEVEKRIADAPDEQRAGLVKLVGQGRPLMVCVPEWPALAVYVSYDDGESWEREGEV